MQRRFVESGMEIEFPVDWEILNYDAVAERWRPTPQKLFPCAVDFILLKPGKKICLLELKGFAGFGPSNRHKLSDGSLEESISLKVRDSIAGVIGFARTGDVSASFAPFAKALGDCALRMEITLWIEVDPALFQQREKRLIDWRGGKQETIRRNIEKARDQRHSTFLNRMKKGLAWASSEVQICNRGNIGVLFPGTTVRDVSAN